ncbi:MAG: Hsp20/alpha crystallin family protein [Chloroflexi bacterium]|nr:MAG: Hsp20/alpha crystallin family protein [Chloroflexota bacterium]
MDQLFEQSFVRPNMMSGAAPQLAPMDICETQNGYEVDVALPGVRPEDIELTVDQNTLTIRGRFSHQNEHQDQPEGQAQAQQQAQAGQTPGQQQAQASQTPGQQQAQASQTQGQQQTQQDGGQQTQQGKTERHRRGSFERVVTFPRPIDTNNVQTKFENGILTIMLPVSEGSRPKRISITGGQSQPQQVPVETGQRQEAAQRQETGQRQEAGQRQG